MKFRTLCIMSSVVLAGVLLAAAPNPPTPDNASGGRAARGGGGGAGAGRGGRGAAPVVTKLAEPADVPVFRVDQQWYGRHDANVVRAKQGNIDLYMLGDSITDNWGGGNVRGGGGNFAASWNKYIAGWNAANFGIGGDRTEQVLWRLKNGELDGVAPKAIVILLGTNNIPASQYSYSPVSPEEAAKGYKAVLDVVREKQPQAKVLLVSVFPRADQEVDQINDRVKKLNSQISKFADGKQVVYLDIYDKFIDKDGKLVPGLLGPDSLHPAAPGYDVWGQAMLPILTEWLGPPKAAAAQ